jgi:hypothetical protein
MNTNKRRGLPAGLEGSRRRFERWRKTRKVGSRIPEPLWHAAVKAGSTYGIHPTAKALRLDYYSLKKRVEQQAAASPGLPGKRSGANLGALPPARAGAAGDVPKQDAIPTFLELPPVGSAVRAECIVELEDCAGAKMRVHIKNVESPDLTGLCRSFWGIES